MEYKEWHAATRGASMDEKLASMPEFPDMDAACRVLLMMDFCSVRGRGSPCAGPGRARRLAARALPGESCSSAARNHCRS